MEWIEEVCGYDESDNSVDLCIRPASSYARPQCSAQIVDESGCCINGDASKGQGDSPFEHFHVDRQTNRVVYAKKHFSQEGNCTRVN